MSEGSDPVQSVVRAIRSLSSAEYERLGGHLGQQWHRVLRKRGLNVHQRGFGALLRARWQGFPRELRTDLALAFAVAVRELAANEGREDFSPRLGVTLDAYERYRATQGPWWGEEGVTNSAPQGGTAFEHAGETPPAEDRASREGPEPSSVTPGAGSASAEEAGHAKGRGPRSVAESLAAAVIRATAALQEASAAVAAGYACADEAVDAVVEYNHALRAGRDLLAERGVDPVPDLCGDVIAALERLAEQENREPLRSAVTAMAAMPGELPGVAEVRLVTTDLLTIDPAAWSAEQVQLAEGLAAVVELARLTSTLEADPYEILAASQRAHQALPSSLHELVILAASRQLRFAGAAVRVESAATEPVPASPTVGSDDPHRLPAPALSASASSPPLTEAETAVSVSARKPAHEAPAEMEDLARPEEAATSTAAQAEAPAETATPIDTVAVNAPASTPQVGTAAPAVPPPTGDWPRQPAGPEGPAGAGAVATAEVDAEPTELDGLEEVPEQLARSVAQGAFDIAALLAEAIGERPVRVSALQAAALARSTTTVGGECSARVTRILAALDGDEVADDLVARLLVPAAACRTALAAPYTGAPKILRDLLGRLTFEPDLRNLLDAVLLTASAGMQPGQVDLAGGGAELERQTAQAAMKAAALLRDGPRRTVTYQAATEVWRSWLRPGGHLRQLLEPASRDERQRAAEVAQAALALREERELGRLIDNTAERLRPHRRSRIGHDARATLLQWGADAVEAVARWAAVAGQGEIASRSSDREVPAARLRRAATINSQRLVVALQAMVPAEADGLERAAVDGATVLLDSVARVARGEERLPEREPSADEVLRAPLLLAWEVPLRAGEASGSPPIRALLGVARPRTLEEAVEGRLRCGDFDVVDRMLALFGRDDPERVDRLAEQTAAAFEQERQALDRLAERRRIELETARRQGVIGDDAWDEFQQRVEAVKGDRRDLRTVRQELDSIKQELDAGTRAAVLPAREELAAAAVSGGSGRRIAELLDQGEIATARVYLDLARSGKPLPQPASPQLDLAAVFPTVVEGLHRVRIDARVPPLAGTGQQVGPIAFSELPADTRKAAQQAVGSWIELRASRTGGSLKRDLRAALAVLGLDLTAIIRVEDDSRAVTRALPRRWVEVTAKRNGAALVPEFGSRLGDRHQLLLCWETPPERQVHQWVAENRAEGGVICLYFGLATMAFRQHLADLSARPGRGGGRPILLVDDAVFLYSVAQPHPSFETTQRLCLPFTAVNPYAPYETGLVAEEMFYDRNQELERLLDSSGPTLVYGGRQIGKSALLRAVQRNGNGDGQQAIYLDLVGHDWGGVMPSDEVWRLIDEELGRIGIPVGKATKASRVADRAAQRIRAWLDEDRRRRFLLLLDEVDAFLNADADRDFPVVGGLRRLREETERRFKPILTGLHQVARFTGASNDPLLHFEPMVVGPLAAQEALDLVVKPLDALGYQIDPVGATRILTYTHFNPGLIQLFCRELVEHLHRRPWQRRPVPLPVGVDLIEQVHADIDLTRKLRERFMATLHLDHRYLVIVDALAREGDEAGGPCFIDHPDLRSLCDLYWPAGFGDVSDVEFRSLLEELIALRLLRERAGAYGIAGPDVRRMLGTMAEVAATLDNSGDLQPPIRFRAASARPALDEHGLRRSPFTNGQLADLLAPAARGRLLLGTEATQIGQAVPALKQEAKHRPDTLVVRIARSADELASLLDGWRPDGRHLLAVADLPTAPDQVRAALDLAPAAVARSAASAVIVVDAADLSVWGTLADADAGGVEPVALLRWDTTGLHHWLTCLSEAPLSPSGLRAFLDATGGWPYLVEQAVRELHGTRDLKGALDHIRDHYASPEGANYHLAAVGLADDAMARRIFDTIIEYGEAETSELALLLEDLPEIEGHVSGLRRLGVVTLNEAGRVAPEPVTAKAWLVAAGG